MLPILPPAVPVDIRAFQGQNLNHLGRPLKADGILGPQTQWALDFATLAAARRNLVRNAQVHIGLCEEPYGSNSDKAGTIRDWLLRCGAPPGDAWCAAYLSHCLGLRIAGAQALGRHYPATTQPVCGDVFWFPTEGWRGHCGLVIGVSSFEVMTIEGNCANAVRCVRRPRAPLRFARTLADVTGVCPGVLQSVPPAPKGTR